MSKSKKYENILRCPNPKEHKEWLKNHSGIHSRPKGLRHT
jgi:hypothetical protein